MELKARLGGRPYNLIVSTYQACVLLLFNDTGRLLVSEVLEKLGVDSADVKRHIVSLLAPKVRHGGRADGRTARNNRFTATRIPAAACTACPHQVKLLNKASKGRDVEDDDMLELNPQFKSKSLRVRVPLVALKDGGAAAAATLPAAVQEDRRHLVEASIVRIMKARKMLDLNQLIAEVTRQLSTRFRPTPQDIKLRVEALIEREYLERTEADQKVLRYLA